MIALLILLACSMGIVSTVQSTSNGLLAGHIGLSSAVLINAVVLLTGAIVFFFVTQRSASGSGPAAWYLYFGGLMGLFIITAAAFAFPRLGAGPTTALMITAQLGAALLFDQLGVAGDRIPVTPGRLLGALMLVGGALLVLGPKLGSSD